MTRFPDNRNPKRKQLDLAYEAISDKLYDLIAAKTPRADNNYLSSNEHL